MPFITSDQKTEQARFAQPWSLHVAHCNVTKLQNTQRNELHIIHDKFVLTPTPAVPNCCCSKGLVPYWSNPPFLISDIRALWRSVLSAKVPRCQKLKMVDKINTAKCKALMGSAVKGLTTVSVSYTHLTLPTNREV